MTFQSYPSEIYIHTSFVYLTIHQNTQKDPSRQFLHLAQQTFLINIYLAIDSHGSNSFAVVWCPLAEHEHPSSPTQ